MYKNLILAFFIILVAGCSSPIRVLDQSEQKLINYPQVGEVVSKKIGDVILAKGIQTFGEAAKVIAETQFNKKDGESSMMTCALSVVPDTAYMRGVYETKSTSADCYGPVLFRRTLADGNTNWNCPGNPLIIGDICKEQDGKIFLAIASHKTYLKQDFDNIKFSKMAIKGKYNFVQEIIYNGRSGDNVKFVYRELSESLIKPIFFQELEYDISQSQIVNFKNVSIEVVNATNTDINYRLISNF
ncbi:MAG: hypothetical protein ACI89T_001246 [Cognaticolwellia sp.]|jgi:hypothetical protein